MKLSNLTKIVPLTQLECGETGKIMSIEGGYGIRQKLSLRDIKEGNIVRIVSSFHGPVVIEVNRNTVALGRGICTRIMVEKKNNNERWLR